MKRFLRLISKKVICLEGMDLGSKRRVLNIQRRGSVTYTKRSQKNSIKPAKTELRQNQKGEKGVMPMIVINNNQYLCVKKANTKYKMLRCLNLPFFFTDNLVRNCAQLNIQYFCQNPISFSSSSSILLYM